MAVRAGILKRFFSTSMFASQSPAVSAAASAGGGASANPAPVPSTSLFVSGFALVGLNKRTTSEKLREAFSKFGEVDFARVVTDRVSGYSKGFGFVRYATIEEAEQGIKGMDGQFLDGWVIFAEYARPRAPPGSYQPPSSNVLDQQL